MANLSGNELSLEEIAIQKQDTEDGLILLFNAQPPQLINRHNGTSLTDARDNALKESEMMHCLALLSSIEASIRIDFINRVNLKKKSPISREMRILHSSHGLRTRLEEDLIKLWKSHGNMPASTANNLIVAFKYRHWLAHGRYWVLRIGRSYDFLDLYTLSYEFREHIKNHP